VKPGSSSGEEVTGGINSAWTGALTVHLDGLLWLLEATLQSLWRWCHRALSLSFWIRSSTFIKISSCCASSSTPSPVHKLLLVHWTHLDNPSDYCGEHHYIDVSIGTELFRFVTRFECDGDSMSVGLDSIPHTQFSVYPMTNGIHVQAGLYNPSHFVRPSEGPQLRSTQEAGGGGEEGWGGDWALCRCLRCSCG
jgi:hypothetical protein